jgi:prephenate dehydratase
MTTAFLGPRGTFSEDAAVQWAGSDGDLLPMQSIPALVAAVENAEADDAVLPLENSIEGSISATLDLLIHETDLPIVAELVIPVRLCLIGLPGAALDQIKTVSSHSNPLGQSRRFLERTLPGVTQVAAMSTAAAVQDVIESGDLTRAAIGTFSAIDRFGGEVLASDIQDVQTNVTRFAVLSRTEAAPTGDDKTSVAFTVVEDVPGSLLKAMTPLADHGLQLTKVESRPSKSHLGNYVFLVDFLGHKADAQTAQALADFRAECLWLKVFGSYPRVPLETLAFARPHNLE